MPTPKLLPIARKALRSPRAWIMLTLISLFSCLDPFNGPVLDSDSMLVIDGLVDTKSHLATVKLTHTKNLRDEDESDFETHARVGVLNEQGEIFKLTETSPGIYQFTNIPLNNGDKCSLRILLGDGREYESDVIELKYSPPIDSLTYTTDEFGVYIQVNTHDPSENSRYYHWTSIETWEYTAANFSALKQVNGQFLPRLPSEVVYRCWRDGPSPKINVSNTLGLQNDVLTNYQLTSIPKGSQKTSIRYSINVVQRVVTKAEYDYTTQLLKTTESLGGLFDPQPTSVYGNIHSTPGVAQPLGYFSGGSSDEKRIYVDWLDLPDDLRLFQSRIGCQPDTVPTALRGSIAPTDYVLTEVTRGFSLFGWLRSNDDCSDCRKQGGKTMRPSFWEARKD